MPVSKTKTIFIYIERIIGRDVVGIARSIDGPVIIQKVCSGRAYFKKDFVSERFQEKYRAVHPNFRLQFVERDDSRLVRAIARDKKV